MSVRIVGLNDVNTGFSHMIRETPKASMKNLVNASKETRQIMKDHAPRATGKFASTIDYRILHTLVSHIGPKDMIYSGRPVSATLEKGRRPGSTAPPWTALIDRYPALSVAQAVKAAKTIARRGIPGFSYAQKTFMDIDPKMDEYGLKAAISITNAFNK